MSKSKKPKRLTAHFCKRVPPGPKVRFYGDAHSYGLRLRVLPSGHKSWTQRLTVRGKRRDLGLGSFPLVSLEDARSKAIENARAARAGLDAALHNTTFRKVSADCIELDAPSWKGPKYRSDVEAMMERYVYPQLGSRPVSGIVRRDIMAVLCPIWLSKPCLADKLLQRLARTFDYALAMGLTNDSPAKPRIIRAGLPNRPRFQANGEKTAGHLEALPYDQVAGALSKLDATKAHGSSKAVLRFVALTAVRISEARMARWDEVDLPNRGWVVPAARTKVGREHRVPLSDQALALLLSVKTADGGLVFHRNGKALADRTPRSLWKSLGVGGTVHGLRSSFRDWAGERTNAPREVLELCLAHAVGNAVEQAYSRSDLLAKRREVMQAWADYLDSEPEPVPSDHPSGASRR